MHHNWKCQTKHETYPKISLFTSLTCEGTSSPNWRFFILEPETFQKLCVLPLEEPGFKFSPDRFFFSAVINSLLGETYFLIERGSFRAGPAVLRDCNWPDNCKVYFTSLISDPRHPISIWTFLLIETIKFQRGDREMRKEPVVAQLHLVVAE